jgi:hypothetical protein
VSKTKIPPILSQKHYDATSAFTPESLLREARRQKSLPTVAVPEICLLDPDGDIVRHLRGRGGVPTVIPAGPATTPNSTSFSTRGTNTVSWVAQ